jgi:phosphoribosylamine--glycine ligase
MGTKIDDNGNLVTNGGRVLFCVGKGKTLEEANKNALKIVADVKCDNLFHRTDIGAKAYKKF